MAGTSWHEAVARGINETIRIIDDAPAPGEYHPYYSAAVSYPKAAMLRAALEVGVGSLLLLNRVECDPSQDLGVLYRRIPDQIQRRLAGAFDDAVAVYGYDPKYSGTRWLSSVPEYLKESDRLRYWAGKVKNWNGHQQQAFIQAGRELARYIASLLCPPPAVSDGPSTIRELINGRIKIATVYAIRHNRECDPGNDTKWWDTNSTMELRVKEYGSHLDAFRAAYNAGFEIGSPRADQVMQDVHEGLRQDCGDPAQEICRQSRVGKRRQALQRVLDSLEREGRDVWEHRPALRHVLNSLEQKETLPV